MIIAIIVARGSKGEIGLNNELLWHLPEDLQFFKSTTMGCPIIMGRKTFESIGRVLPGRKNVVVSRNPNLEIAGATVVSNLNEAFSQLEGAEKVFIIGGGSIYAEALENQLASEVYITQINQEYQADTFISWPQDGWILKEETKGTAAHFKPSFTYQKWVLAQ